MLPFVWLFFFRLFLLLRNPDALSSCCIHLLSSESALLERVVAVVREYDPDILLGWDVQGASWGWLVERAQHLCFTQPVSSAPIPSPSFHLRNPDALSSCRIHLLSSEVALLECLVAVVRQYDPDILLGWEVQGGSWGWLAERAQHLGFNLLKSLSRVPPVHDVRVAQARAPFKCDTPEAPASSVPPALVQSQPVQSQPVQSHPVQSHTPQSHPAQPIPLQSPHAAVTSELPLDSQDISATPLQSQRHLSPSFPPMGPSQSPVSPPLATAPPDAALSDAATPDTTPPDAATPDTSLNISQQQQQQQPVGLSPIHSSPPILSFPLSPSQSVPIPQDMSAWHHEFGGFALPPARAAAAVPAEACVPMNSSTYGAQVQAQTHMHMQAHSQGSRGRQACAGPALLADDPSTWRLLIPATSGVGASGGAGTRWGAGGGVGGGGGRGEGGAGKGDERLNRAELARVFGIDFFSVLSRGSQYRVESMLLQLALSQDCHLSPSPPFAALRTAISRPLLPLPLSGQSHSRAGAGVWNRLLLGVVTGLPVPSGIHVVATRTLPGLPSLALSSLCRSQVNRTAELARVFGIDFFSVLSRGSQYRVESMMLRLAHSQNYLLISPSRMQVTACCVCLVNHITIVAVDDAATRTLPELPPPCFTSQLSTQPAPACIPLVMEPECRYYTSPVVVLSLSIHASSAEHPAYSSLTSPPLCTSSAYFLSTPPPHHLPPRYPPSPSSVHPSGDEARVSLLPQPHSLLSVLPRFSSPSLLSTLPPSGGGSVSSFEGRPAAAAQRRDVCAAQGVLPRLLKEILATRVMVKKAMKKLQPGSKHTRVLHRVLNARQFALKLIANVTYGYTAASFSGRMPMAELADSIVQAGRTTLERAIALVNSHPSWNARVVYGDTDRWVATLTGGWLSLMVEGKQR
ncbi:unnamed protein product [Closterium sp. Naga37s-1]|nr:unnamed protein product [Closterium sp. Naga37s-1]